MLIFLLILFSLRPFISSLSNPGLNLQYTYLLIALCLFLIKSNIETKKALGSDFPGQNFLLLFFLAIIASAFLSLQPLKSLKALPAFLSYFFVFYALRGAGAKEKHKIVSTLIFTAAGVSLYAVYWFYWGWRDAWALLARQDIADPFAREFLLRRRAFMPFVLPNALAAFLLLVLPVSTGYLLERKRGQAFFLFKRPALKNKPVPFFFMALAILLMAATLLLTQSVGVICSIFLALFFFFILFRAWNKKNLLFLLIIFLILISIFILRSEQPEHYLRPVFSFTNRLTYWRNTGSIIARHPLWGVGLGNLTLKQSQFAHNSYLQIWAETGLAGIISLWGYLFCALKALRRRAPLKDKLYSGYIVACLGFLIHNFVDFSFYLPEIALFWWIIMALLL